MNQQIRKSSPSSSTSTSFFVKISTFSLLLILIIQSWFIIDVDGCFITNCPTAGKRSALQNAFPNHHRQQQQQQQSNGGLPSKECTRCGPGLSGRCYGPNICCSPLFGCNIGGFASARCSLEQFSPVLCSNPGERCGSNGKGLCATNVTCCTNDGCFHDITCKLDTFNDNQIASELVTL